MKHELAAINATHIGCPLGARHSHSVPRLIQGCAVCVTSEALTRHSKEGAGQARVHIERWPVNEKAGISRNAVEDEGESKVSMEFHMTKPAHPWKEDNDRGGRRCKRPGPPTPNGLSQRSVDSIKSERKLTPRTSLSARRWRPTLAMASARTPLGAKPDLLRSQILTMERAMELWSVPWEP